MANILINLSTNVVGGAVKNGACFIREISKENLEDNFFFLISPDIFRVLKSWGIELNSFLIISSSPAKSYKSRRYLKYLERKLKIDLVYTMAGPAYVKFSSKHIMGISNPYITHAPLRDILRNRSFLNILVLFFRMIYERYWSRFADIYVFQTESSRDGFKKKFSTSKSLYVIENALDELNFDSNEQNLYAQESNNIFCPAGPYPHKMLESIPSLCHELKKSIKNVNFYLSIDQYSKTAIRVKKNIHKFQVEENIHFFGSYNYSDLEKVYSNFNYVYVPSIIETYSANYLEAFFFKKPLIVSDRKFSRDICKDAALFIDPLNPRVSASIIAELINSDTMKDSLIKKGKEILKKTVTQRERFIKIQRLIKKHIE